MPRFYTSLRNHGVLLLVQLVQYRHGTLVVALLQYLCSWENGALFHCQREEWTEENALLFSVAVNLLLFLFAFTDYSVEVASPYSAFLTPAFYNAFLQEAITQCSALKRLCLWDTRLPLTHPAVLFYTSYVRSLFLIAPLRSILHLAAVDEAGDVLWTDPALSLDSLLWMRAMGWAPHLFPFQTRVSLFRNSLPQLQNSSAVEIKVRRDHLVEDTQAVFTSMLTTRRQFVQRFFVGVLS